MFYCHLVLHWLGGGRLCGSQHVLLDFVGDVLDLGLDLTKIKGQVALIIKQLHNHLLLLPPPLSIYKYVIYTAILLLLVSL